MKQLLQFAPNMSYFGVVVYRHGVKVDDLKKLPFFDIFTDYHDDKIYLTNAEEDYIPLIDWEGFCYDYVMHGNYRIND
ncbi:MAG TPA: hypothetical protein ENK98_01680 [Epsilonproteobacteria bacterium]|nr:hypothetical protein [Campylobacterota bacterium]